MNSQKTLIPSIRFPEFKEEEGWKLEKVDDLIDQHSEKSDYSNQYPVLTSAREGIMFQRDYYNDRDVASKDNTGYNVVPRGYFTYRHMSDDLVFKFNINNICDRGIVSTLYPVFKVKHEKVLPYFFQQKLNEGPEFRKFAFSQKQGGSRTYMYLSKLKNLGLYIPKLPEQQKITSCLSSLDELIAAHNEKLDVLKDHKKGLMQNLFPQEGQKVPNYRFPEFTESLRHHFYRDLGSIKIGLTHKPEYIKSGVPFLSSKNISAGYIDFEDIQYISEEKFASMPDSTKPKVGDILFTRVGSNLGNPIILEEDIEFGIFVSLGFFRVNKNANNRYIKHWMESDYFWKQVNQKVAGGAKNNLNSTWLKEFELYIPSVPEQEKIASTLDSLDELIISQKVEIEQLQQHKKGLMQGLFPKIEN